MAEFFFTDPSTGPYIVNCPIKMAEALNAGHALLPHEDAYMSAIAADSEMRREHLSMKLDAQREAHSQVAKGYNLTNEQLAAEMAAESYGATGGDQNAIYESILARLNKEDAQDETAQLKTVAKKKVCKSVKSWARPEIDALIQKNPKAVERAMVVLFNRQTADEKAAEYTKHHNNRGFAAYAARSGTYYARWVLKGRRLTGHHLAKARKIALKHSRQLVEEANSRGA